MDRPQLPHPHPSSPGLPVAAGARIGPALAGRLRWSRPEAPGRHDRGRTGVRPARWDRRGGRLRTVGGGHATHRRRREVARVHRAHRRRRAVPLGSLLHDPLPGRPRRGRRPRPGRREGSRPSDQPGERTPVRVRRGRPPVGERPALLGGLRHGERRAALVAAPDRVPVPDGDARVGRPRSVRRRVPGHDPVGRRPVRERRRRDQCERRPAGRVRSRPVGGDGAPARARPCRGSRPHPRPVPADEPVPGRDRLGKGDLAGLEELGEGPCLDVPTAEYQAAIHPTPEGPDRARGSATIERPWAGTSSTSRRRSIIRTTSLTSVTATPRSRQTSSPGTTGSVARRCCSSPGPTNTASTSSAGPKLQGSTPGLGRRDGASVEGGLGGARHRLRRLHPHDRAPTREGGPAAPHGGPRERPGRHLPRYLRGPVLRVLRGLLHGG